MTPQQLELLIAMKIKDCKEFWETVEVKDSLDECWPWKGTTNKRYGRFRFQGKAVWAHCYSASLVNGQIPHGVLVCHTCDNPPCVNPNHLFLGTRRDNTRDAQLKGRLARGPSNARYRNPGHFKLKEQQVAEIRRLYGSGGITHKTLGALFGVSPQTIQDITIGRAWAWVRSNDNDFQAT